MGIVRADDGTEYRSWAELFSDGQMGGTQEGDIIETVTINTGSWWWKVKRRWNQWKRKHIHQQPK